MKLHVLGSSSRGNCYLLRSETTGEALAIEAGVRFIEVEKALCFDLSRVAGCIVSHEHGDHARYVGEFARRCIPVYMSYGTYAALKEKGMDARVYPTAPMVRVKAGGFEVMAFPVEHDAREPFGYLIKHPECGTVVFATDTYYLRNRFKGVSNWLLECNYRLDLLEGNIARGRVPAARRDRTLKSHMGYGTCLETLLANDLTATNNIVLIHLSSENSDERAFVSGIRDATGKDVFAARRGMVLDFNRTPY